MIILHVDGTVEYDRVGSPSHKEASTLLHSVASAPPAKDEHMAEARAMVLAVARDVVIRGRPRKGEVRTIVVTAH